MTKPLTDGFVFLRRFRESDVQEVYEAVRESIPHLSPWFSWCHEGYAISDAEDFICQQAAWWENGEAYNFAITDRKTGAYCGGCLLNDINDANRFANMAYWVRSSRIGEGIATASARLVAKFAFQELRLNRVEIAMAIENTASMRVAEKIDARREGRLRKRIQIRDKTYDAFMYSLVPEDLITAAS